MEAGAIIAVSAAAILGVCLLGMGMRGQYFGICTLGLGVTTAELANGWEYIGAGSGLVTPVFPDCPALKIRSAHNIYYLLHVDSYIEKPNGRQ